MLSSWPVSDDVRVAFAPDATWRALREDGVRPSLTRTLARAALANAVLVFMMPLMVTGGITAGSLAFSALCWGFVAVLQTLLGVALVWSWAARPVSVLRGLELWFTAHLPFSVWLLVVAAFVMYTNRLAQLWVLATAIVPVVWTNVLLHSYCRVVLGMSGVAARRRVAVEQTAAWLLVTAYVLFAAGGANGVLSFVARQIGWIR
jgi:hypothetical protein